MAKKSSRRSGRKIDIEKLISKMTLEQKVGQLFTLGFSGGVLNPVVIKMVNEYQCGGLRITPNYIASFKKYRKVGEGMTCEKGKGERKQDVMPNPSVHLSPKAHLDVLNDLQKMAVKRKNSIPLHISMDCEGGGSGDITRGGYPLFPSAMGLACAKDEKVVYKVTKATAEMYRASGATNIHSPVVDINVNPNNPEINIRAYGDTAKQTAKYALAAMRGFMDGGLVPTAKHFPGRGDSDQDAHYDLPVLKHSKKHLMKNELYPYKVLIKNGLPSIMLAHQIAPALGDKKYPATISEPVIQNIIRGELGFKGVITTDSITMEGILKLYPQEEASARAIAAGVDLVLFKNEDIEGVEATLKTTADFIKKGIISEKRVHDSLVRILKMKQDLGLFKTKGQCQPKKLEKVISAPRLKKLSRDTARKATLLVRDRNKLLPVKKKQKVLVVEQSMFTSRYCNDEHYHPYVFWEKIRKHSPGADLVKLEFTGTDDDYKEVIRRAKDFDVVIATNYYNRGAVPNTEFLTKLAKKIDNLVVVTSTPYPITVTDEMDCVLCVFSVWTPSLEVAADIIFGKVKAGRTWPTKYKVKK